MVQVFVWIAFGLFMILMVVCALSMFITAPADDDNIALKLVDDDNLSELKLWLKQLTAGRVLSDEDRADLVKSLDKLRSGKSFLCVARWVVYLLKKCPSTNWKTISYRIRQSHEVMKTRRCRTAQQIALNAVCYAECDSLMYTLRQNQLLA